MWLKLPSNPRYEVSSTGKIRLGKVILAQSLNPKNGYLTVKIARRTMNVHSLVALTFIGPAPSGKEVNHKDTDKRNNRSRNLEYLTRSENMIHRYEHGESKTCRLDAYKVREIRRLRSSHSLRMLAHVFGVSKGTIVFITTGKTWKWVT